MEKTVNELLKRPYTRIMRPAEEGGFVAEVLEFPGCVTQGETVEEAYANLEEAARGWIEAVIDIGQNVPEPASDDLYSGKVVLRLPRSLHRLAALLADRDGVSLNTFLATAIAERVGAVARPTAMRMKMRGTAEGPSPRRVTLGMTRRSR